jgi:hypothetical protein
MHWGASVLPKRFAAITTGALALSCGMAQACVIDMPSCISASNGLTSSRFVHSPVGTDVALFYEYSAAEDGRGAMFLVECKSRKGVKINLSEGDEAWSPGSKVADYLTEAATSEKTYSLSQIRADLRALGRDSRMTTLPAGHCGCELPKMEIIGCGEFGP